jgi:hypothetical protein
MKRRAPVLILRNLTNSDDIFEARYYYDENHKSNGHLIFDDEFN